MNDLVNQFDVVSGAEQAIDVQASGTAHPADWFVYAMTGGVLSDTGQSVSLINVLGLPGVWQALNILAGDIGQIPIRKMARKPTSGDRFEVRIDRGSRLDRMVREQPNHFQTIEKWKETVMFDALIWGNHVSAISRDETGAPMLVPLEPQHTTYEEVRRGDYLITSRLRTDSGHWEEFTFEYRDVVHISGLASDGFWGLPLTKVLKNALGYGLALQSHGNRFFANGAKPSGVLQHPGSLPADARKNLRDDWNNVHRGTENTGKIAILWEGVTYHAISVTNEEAQFLESRKLDREYTASIFNLPAYKLNSMENSAVRANLEEQAKEYYTTSLSRWAVKIAQELDRKMLTDVQRSSQRHFFKWFPEAFLQGDAKSRAEVYAMAIRDRWMNPNEVRQLEDLNPYAGGDEFANPAIEPMGGNGEDNQQAEETTDSSEANETGEAVENLLVERLNCMLQSEATHVQNAARSAHNFVEWLDGFFGRFETFAGSYLAAACEVADACGRKTRPLELAEMYARQRRGELLTVSGEIDQAGLADRIVEFCNESPQQRDGRARLLLKYLEANDHAE